MDNKIYVPITKIVRVYLETTRKHYYSIGVKLPIVGSKKLKRVFIGYSYQSYNYIIAEKWFNEFINEAVKNRKFDKDGKQYEIDTNRLSELSFYKPRQKKQKEERI